METLGKAEGFEFKLSLDEDKTYILCDLGSNMYMFLNPTRRETTLPTVLSPRPCWVCNKEENGVFCHSGLFFGEGLVNTQPVHICMNCFSELTKGWSKISEDASIKTVSEKI